MAEMTDAQLSERVCRVLGIEPWYGVSGDSMRFRTKESAEEFAGTFNKTPEIYPLAVLEMEGR